MNKDMNELLLVSNKKLTKLKLVILIRIEQEKFSKLFDEIVVHIHLKKDDYRQTLSIASLGVFPPYFNKICISSIARLRKCLAASYVQRRALCSNSLANV